MTLEIVDRIFYDNDNIYKPFWDSLDTKFIVCSKQNVTALRNATMWGAVFDSKLIRVQGYWVGSYEVSQFRYLTRHDYNNKYFVERSFLRPIRIKIYNDTMRKCLGMGVTPIFFASTVYSIYIKIECLFVCLFVCLSVRVSITS